MGECRCWAGKRVKDAFLPFGDARIKIEGEKVVKMMPMRYEEFADCLTWWKDRQENERAWRVPVSDLIQRDEQGNLISVNLDVKNPSKAEATVHRSPEEIVASLRAKEMRITELLCEIEAALAAGVE